MGANRLSGQSNQTETTIRYLLGTLSDEERDRFEEMYFSDNAAFEEVEIAEGELVDRYVRGELSKSDQACFESVVAGSPRLAHRVEFARVWKDKLAVSPTARPVASPTTYKTHEAAPSWWASLFGSSSGSRAPRLAFALTVLLLLLGGVALLAGWLRVREESRRLEAQRAALEQRQRELDQQAAALKSQAEQWARGVTPSPTPGESPQPKPSEEPGQQNPRSVVAVTLSPGGLRAGGGGTDIRILPETREIEVTLYLRDPGYASYTATVLPVGGPPIFSRPSRPQRSVIVLRIPAKRLPLGDYQIKLDGRTSSGTTDNLDDYFFRVVK